MKVQSVRQGKNLYFYLSGELDEHTVGSARNEVDRLIEANLGYSRAIFNLAMVQFMDSTGIGFLIGRYKKLKRLGVEMGLENPNVGAEKVLELSGVYSLIPRV